MPATLTRAEVLQHALAIAAEYRREGLTLTLRQLYYQFVARGLAPSGQRHYKRIGDVLTAARYRGSFPPGWIEDRGREVTPGRATRRIPTPDRLDLDAGSLLQAIPRALVDVDRWAGQPWYVSVWVEKEALAGVFEDPCATLGVSLFPCRGYPSVSALWAWLKQARAATSGALERVPYTYLGDADVEEWHRGTAERCVVLYFGDHDPDGLEIPESAERDLRRLADLPVDGFTPPPLDLAFRRVALNRDQIAEYRPPPFPGKESSTRYRAYVERTGTSNAWELDALEPRILRRLIERSVADYWDEAIHQANAHEEAAARRPLAGRLPVLVAHCLDAGTGGGR